MIYTSGTTGRPKGCQLTHGNFLVELGVATTLLHEVFDVEDASTLLFLPLAHVFARIISIGCVQARVRVGHTADIKNLVDDLGAFRPTFVLAVPRVFEKVFNTASGRAASDGKGKVFNAAVSTAIAYSQAQDRSGPGVLLRARHAMFDRLVYSRLRAALGGNLQYAVSGGAPLGRAARPLLPRRRGADPRGVRPDRDHGRRDRQPAACPAHRHRRQTASRYDGAGRRTTAS